MVETYLFKKGTVLGIILLFIFECCMPGLTGTSIMKRNQQISLTGRTDEAAEKTVVTCVAFGKTHNSKQTIALSQDNASMVFEMFQELKSSMTQYPFSETTQSMKRAFVDLLDEKGLLSQGVSKEVYLSLLNPRWVERLQRIGNKSSSTQSFKNNSGTCILCSVGCDGFGEGLGVLIPLVLLPRPRIAMMWNALMAVSTAANLLTCKGYLAYGAQKGFALGFIGIGIFYVINGTNYTLFAFIGYALLASTTAEVVEYYPPNSAPNKPSQPSGKTNGKIGQEYSYTTSTTDPDGDQVYYLWDWGDDNNSGWLGPYNSRATCEAKHIWNAKDNYNITVKAKDIYGKESSWSNPLPIVMPYSFNKPIPQFLELLFQRFPHAVPILRHLVGY